MLTFSPCPVDHEPAAGLVARMREEIARIYDGLDLTSDAMPSAGVAELSPPGGSFLVGYDDGEAVCCGGLKALGDGACEIKRMYVAESARGRGMARALLVALEDEARRLGHVVARLDTGPRQPHAQRLYESTGYVAIENFNANPMATFFGEKRLRAPEVAEEPERRARPPWVMAEMMDLQLQLPGLLGRGGAADRLGVRLREALAAGQPVLLTGCGTSEHAARAGAAILREAFPQATVDARDAFEARLAPPATGLVVGVSHEAGTASTLEAVRAAVAAGADGLLLTAHPERAPDGLEAIGTPIHDRSWCHTVAYASALLCVAPLAGLTAERARELMAREHGDLEDRARDSARLRGCERLLVVGSGVDEVTASELALKVEEAAHLPCTPLGAEKVLHGHLPAADRSTGLVLLRFDPDHAAERDERSAGVAAAAEVLDMPTVTLGRPDLATGAEALIAGALALQGLTLGLCTALGTNPDLIRREQEPYRRAAAVAGVG